MTKVGHRRPLIYSIPFCSRGGEVVQGYDFLVNAVWPEIVANIEARTPSIFAPGNPNLFHEVNKAVCCEFCDNPVTYFGSLTHCGLSVLITALLEA